MGLYYNATNFGYQFCRTKYLRDENHSSCLTHIHTKEKNMSKTPYEIRLELLNLAKEILQTPIYQTREAKLQEYHSKLTDANRESHPFPTLPDFPSSTDIVAKAEELKKFVDQA
jgi:hypothetical protein